jgi:hypothetical protein
VRENHFDGVPPGARTKPRGSASSESKPNGGADGAGENGDTPVMTGFNPADWAIDPEPEERLWIVQDYILGETTTMLSGDGGTGKSYLAHQLTIARALGREWIGLLPEPGKTLYLSCEDDLNEMKRRQHGILRFYDSGWVRRFHPSSVGEG